MELFTVVLVIVLAMVFNYTNGFHDAANAIATSVSTRALTPRAALFMAAAMNFIGAHLGTQVEVIQRCSEITADAMPKLQSMQDLEEYWIEINRLENAGDKNHRRILAKLFSGEFKTIEVLKLKDIVESLEEAIDAFEKVANIVEQIAVKES